MCTKCNTMCYFRRKEAVPKYSWKGGKTMTIAIAMHTVYWITCISSITHFPLIEYATTAARAVTVALAVARVVFLPLGSNHICNAYKNVKDHQHNCDEQKWKSLTLTMANGMQTHQIDVHCIEWRKKHARTHTLDSKNRTRHTCYL